MGYPTITPIGEVFWFHLRGSEVISIDKSVTFKGQVYEVADRIYEGVVFPRR